MHQNSMVGLHADHQYAAAVPLLLLLQGLYTVDFSGPQPIITAANAVQADGGHKQYNDIKWASKTGKLYASAGDAVAVDVLELQQM
jgi:hypothetical protein